MSRYDCYDKNVNGFAGYEFEQGDYSSNLSKANNSKSLSLETIFREAFSLIGSKVSKSSPEGEQGIA